ncbi:MAG: CDP-alcohol phosphatidyltransferase family protein [Nitrospiria bacterium]
MINIPNLITCGRLLIANIGFILMLTDHWKPAFLLILFSVLLDAMDGEVARRLNQVSQTGIFLDIMADKIVIISTFLIVGYKLNPFFFYLGLLMLLREYVIDTLRAIAAARKTVLSADALSKLKGVILMTAMVGAIGNHAFLGSAWIEGAMAAMGAIGMTLAYVTLGRFYLKCRDLQVF